MIEMQDINKIYRQGNNEFYALKNINLTINKGESIAILGKSGSGKSTLLNIMGGIDNANSGKYLFENLDVLHMDTNKLAHFRNENIGFIVQDYALLSQKTVLFNTMLPLLFSKVPYKKIKNMALEVLKMLDIEEMADKNVNQLSGGQKQRVAIARALVNNPKLILADEPTGALDSKTSAQIMQVLSQINKKGVTLIVVTHDRQIADYCQKQIYIADGEIVQSDNL